MKGNTRLGRVAESAWKARWLFVLGVFMPACAFAAPMLLFR
jgi:hypothetical protein